MTTIALVTTMLALVTVMGAVVAIVVVGTGRIRRDNATLILASTFLVVGPLSWVAWAPLVTMLLASVPTQWLQVASIAAIVMATAALLGLYLLATTYDTKLQLYLKRKAGMVGERKVQRALERAGFEAVHGVYVPYGNGVRQLDHIALVGRCLIVLESKNWQGEYYGRADEPTWTKKIDGSTSRIDNPLRQLDGQVMALKSVVGEGVRGFVVFGDRCEFPGDMPNGAVHLCELTRKLEMLRLAAPINKGDESKAWGKLQQVAADTRLQQSLKVKHDAWVVARPRNPEAQPIPYIRKCKSCGETDALTLKEPSRSGYSWYWRCECDEATPVDLARGWRFERQGSKVVCKSADGRILTV